MATFSTVVPPPCSCRLPLPEIRLASVMSLLLLRSMRSTPPVPMLMAPVPTTPLAAPLPATSVVALAMVVVPP